MLSMSSISSFELSNQKHSKEMKKVIKLTAVFILSVSAVAANATETSMFKVYSAGDMKINVEVLDIQGRATGYVMDANNRVIFEKKLKNREELNITFDVSSLEEGNYQFVLKDDFKRRSVPFELVGDRVVVKEEESKRTNFPQIVQDERNVLVKLLSDESNDLHIRIKTQDGESLFDEKLEGKLGLIGKRFEFESGEYILTLISANYSKTKYLSF